MRVRFLWVMVVFLAAAALMQGLSWYFLSRFGGATGRVVEAGTGAPVGDAAVEMYAEFTSNGQTMKLNLHSTTAADGTWSLERTVGGTYRLTVTHPGYETLVKEDVVLAPQEQNAVGTVELTRRAD